jgi:hypothetical protein
MRVIARRERPHPGAQLHLTDHNGWRITCFATNTHAPGWTLDTLEVRHRQRARAEDRIRGLKDTGMRNLPSTTIRPTRSGSKSSPWPPTCSPGPKPSPSINTHQFGGGNQNDYDCASSPSPAASSAAAADNGSDYPATGPGTTSSTPDTPRSAPPEPRAPNPTTRNPNTLAAHKPQTTPAQTNAPGKLIFNTSPGFQMKDRG